MKSVLWSASALLLCVAATPMKAAEIVQEPSVGIRLGVLTCRLDGGPGFVVVSSSANFERQMVKSTIMKD